MRITVKRAVMAAIILCYAVLMAGFLYFDFIDFQPRTADVFKFSTSVLSFAAAAFLWRDSRDRFDGTVLLIALFITIINDIFLVFLQSHYDIGVAFYGLTMTVYFFRYHRGRFKLGLIIPLFLIIPLLLLNVFHIDSQTSAAAYYIQILITNLAGVVLSVRKGVWPKFNAGLIIVGICLFVLGDVAVLLRNFTVIRRAIPEMAYAAKFIWIFYTPSLALMAFSANDYEKDRNRALKKDIKAAL